MRHSAASREEFGVLLSVMVRVCAPTTSAVPLFLCRGIEEGEGIAMPDSPFQREDAEEGRSSSGNFRGTLEYVPGKQVTLAHVIRNPRKSLCSSVGVDHPGALGLMTITPGEGSIIAADIASKSAAVNIEFVDRFTGCLLFTGEVSAVETALRATVQSLKDILGFFPASIPHS